MPKIGRFFEDHGRLEDDFGGVGNRTPGTVQYINEAGVPDEVAKQAFAHDDIASALDQWSRNLGSPATQSGSLFFRNRYSMTSNVYDQMIQCTDAVEYDEILSATCDATEGLAFQKMSFECLDQDQEDIWNQVAADLDMDSRLREMWREMFKVSQCYVAVEWQEKIYKVRTKAAPQVNMDDTDPVTTPGVEVPGAEDLHSTGVPNPGPVKKRARRKQFAIRVPSSLSIIDPTKVLPVGQLMFGRERFAYIASRGEHEAFMQVFEGKGIDPTVLAMFEGPYQPTQQELAFLTDAHRGPENKTFMWLFRPEAMFRHTLSRAHYERFSSVRLKSILPLLDMKAHLRASDRAALIGATNFIVVLKRGSDKFPARAGEVEQLREQARTVARMPILVGDHRLSVEIITPDTDNVLKEDRYDLIDERLIMRAMHSFGVKQGHDRAVQYNNDVIARGIEARRHEVARTIEEKLLRATVDMNPTALSEVPSLAFHPRRVVISMNADVVNAVLKLRAQGDISRETQLEEFNYDQEIEYIRRKREKATDPVFKSQVPFSSPESNPFQTGTQGGRPAGGGGPNALNHDPSGAAPSK